MAPTVSEQAVHINDRASAVFVIVVVAVFAVIFLNALLLGHRGTFSGLFPTPVVTEEPQATEEPSDSAGASASPAASPSGSPAASASASAPFGRAIRISRCVALGGAVRVSVGSPLGEPGRLAPRWTAAGRAERGPAPDGRGPAAQARHPRRARPRAMGEVQREAFVPQQERGDAYTDGPLPIGGGQTISQPYIVARMTELLAVGPGDRVLDIGTGSGYQAAVLAAMGCLVSSMERHPDLALAAMDRLADAGYGDRVARERRRRQPRRAGGAPLDGIVVTAGAPSIPTRCASSSATAAPRDPGRRPREQQLLRRRAAGQRVARALGRAVRVRAAGGGGRLAAVGRDGH